MKRILYTLSILVFSLLVITSAEAQKKPAVPIEPEFVQFWKEFKIAINKQDKPKIIEMTAFPFYIYNNLTQRTVVVKNANEFENKKLEEYGNTGLMSILGANDLIKQMKTLVKVTDLSGYSEFKFTKDAKVVIAEKEFCTLIFAMVDGKVKLVGVTWSPSDD